MNPTMQEGGTILNPNIQASGTVLNNSLDGNGTVLNVALDDISSVVSGTLLCGKYVVQRKLDVCTGEADLYICTCSGQEYVAKVYRRQLAIKPEVTHSLSQIESPFVARVFEMGEHNGYPVEIIPYYKNGSLQGRVFSVKQLKEDVIPSLNTGLKVLHDHAIIHKDLKPSNIMLNNDGRTVSIIDFGISTVAQDGNTVVVTHTGLTPEYSAPETFRGLFLAESDYYSLGITLFELFAGHSPYEGMTQEQIAQFAVIQKVPLPEDMDSGLKDLITGLTYNDITNRKDKNNPNRRWTFEEVDNWCKGIPQPIPGHSADYNTGAAFRAYRFQGQSYSTMDSLVNALATDWENGKKQLFRGILGGHFNSINAEIASICADAQDEMDNGKKSADLIFFETLYKMNPEITKLYWKGSVFDNLDQFASKLLNATRQNDPSMDSIYHDILTQGVLSAYILCVNPSAKAQIKTLKAFESAHRTYEDSTRQTLVERYQLGYMLSTEKTFVINGKVFRNLDDLVVYMNELLDQSLDTFNSFCQKLLHENGELDAQFESWLLALGKGKAISEWRQMLSA